MYLSSLILGSLYHSDHLSRAVYARCNQIQVSSPYKLNKPLLSNITSPESRQPGKAPNFSCNWLTGEIETHTGFEVISVMQGKTEEGAPSRLCKAEMFRLYGHLWGKIPARIEKPVKIPATYSQAKSLSSEYNSYKQVFLDALSESNLGNWVSKPVEENMFILPTREFVTSSRQPPCLWDRDMCITV